jgi:hypothetical protein
MAWRFSKPVTLMLSPAQAYSVWEALQAYKEQAAEAYGEDVPELEPVMAAMMAQAQHRSAKRAESP